jgi:CRISPR/Cas system CSM-associated protein Csm3 (group 7 of RAMP superfamily)
MLWGIAESPVPGGMAQDAMGGLGDMGMRGYGGVTFRNAGPIDPQMAKA